MKRFIFPLWVGIAAIVSSCSLKEQSQYTPQVVLSYLVCSHVDPAGTDTLRFTQNEDSSFKMDTIHVGDTVRFSVALNSYTNTLTGFSAVWDTTALALTLDSIESIRSGLDAASAPEKGILRFNPGYNFAAFPMHYITRKAGVHNLTLTVESDSKYSPSVLKLMQPVE